MCPLICISAISERLHVGPLSLTHSRGSLQNLSLLQALSNIQALPRESETEEDSDSPPFTVRWLPPDILVLKEEEKKKSNSGALI